MNLRKRHPPMGLLILATCCSLFGCGQTEELLYDPNASSEETSASAQSSEESAPAETESLSYLRKEAEEILSYASESGSRIRDGGMLDFWDASGGSDEPIKYNEYGLPVQDGTLELELNALVYSQDDIDCTVTGTFVLCWNGQICDFSIDGKQSTDGVLQMDMQYFQEITVSFQAENLPMREGDNTFYFCFFPYCGEKGLYLTAQNFIGYYRAEEAHEGQSPILMTAETDLNPELITVITDKKEALTGSFVDLSDFIANNNIWDYTLHANPTFYLNVSNTAAEEPSNRSGIAMFFVDGELQPIWNGAYYAAVSVTDQEYKKVYSIETDFGVGEQHDVLMVYAELQDDKNLSDYTNFYQDACYCTIKE